MTYRSAFDRFSKRIAHFAGHPIAFAGAVALIGLWFISGPLFGFSDGWQLVINTGTTILTFFMVFVSQNCAAIQIKLDELLRTVEGAHNSLLDLEKLNEVELQALRKEYLHLAQTARDESRRARSDTGTPDIQFPS